MACSSCGKSKKTSVSGGALRKSGVNKGRISVGSAKRAAISSVKSTTRHSSTTPISNAQSSPRRRNH